MFGFFFLVILSVFYVIYNANEMQFTIVLCHNIVVTQVETICPSRITSP